MLLGIVDEIIRKKYQITLNNDFIKIFNDIMDYIYSRFGKKSPDLTNDKHLENINKICLDEAIQYIERNVTCFPKIANTERNNRAIVIKGEQPTICQETKSLIPYNDQQNLFRGTDDLLKQMQFDRNNGYNQTQPRMDFQLPTQINSQPTTEQALAIALEQRSKELPYMKTPSYKTSSGSNIDTQMVGTVPNASINGQLMNILLQTPVAMQNPGIVPHLISEIMQMPHLVDLMNKDYASFQQQVANPSFLQMIITQIKNKNDPKMKPMNLNDEIPTQGGTGTLVPPPEGTVNSDYMKMVNTYKNSNLGAPDVNQLNIIIPPSEQLVNNTLPDFDKIHLINYDLSLDFRTDLENTPETEQKNQYPLKFVKFGNISKVKLTSCLIPENGFLAKEPYIYVKIEELGGRCYTANHDTTLGKLILYENKNGYLYYVPDKGSCTQIFSQPMSFQKFTVSFLNYNGKYINPKEISILKSTKLKKENKLKFVTLYKHKLCVGDTVGIHIYHKTEMDMYAVKVETVIDDTTFTVDNCFDTLSEHIVVLYHSFNCSFQFTLYEINWNLLTKKNIQNAQLIKLSQLVSERRHEVLNNIGDDTDIIKYAKNHAVQMPQYVQPVALTI